MLKTYSRIVMDREKYSKELEAIIEAIDPPEDSSILWLMRLP